VATVNNQEGLVTAVANGDPVTITATSGSLSGTATVTVAIPSDRSIEELLTLVYTLAYTNLSSNPGDTSYFSPNELAALSRFYTQNPDYLPGGLLPNSAIASILGIGAGTTDRVLGYLGYYRNPTNPGMFIRADIPFRYAIIMADIENSVTNDFGLGYIPANFFAPNALQLLRLIYETSPALLPPHVRPGSAVAWCLDNGISTQPNDTMTRLGGYVYYPELGWFIKRSN
jgi:hypothetical protein